MHSRRAESREAFAARLEHDVDKKIVVSETWQDCLEGADIMVEAARLTERQELLRTDWVRPGVTVIPYGTVSSLELRPHRCHRQDRGGRIFGQFRAGKLGALRPHIDSGRIGEKDVFAEICDIVAGQKPGRESETEEGPSFWHRGLSPLRHRAGRGDARQGQAAWGWARPLSMPERQSPAVAGCGRHGLQCWYQLAYPLSRGYMRPHRLVFALTPCRDGKYSLDRRSR